MAKYVYPAVFHPNADGSYTVTFPDLPGCITEGKSLDNALYMAQDVLGSWISVAQEVGTPINPASKVNDLTLDNSEFASLVMTNLKDDRAVRRTVSIPQWMDDMVSEAGLSLSRVLQDALRDRLGLAK